MNTPMRKIIILLGICTVLRTELADAQTVTEYRHENLPGYELLNTFRQNYPMTLESPHIKWAAPFALGKLRVLIVMPSQTIREAQELRQRISAEVEIIPTFSHKQLACPHSVYYGADSEEEVLSQARDKLAGGRRYDAIIIGKIKWTILPGEITDLITRAVSAGTSLVFITPWAVDDAFLKKIKWDEKTELLDAIRQTVPIDILPLDEKDLYKKYPQSNISAKTIRRVGPLEIKTGRLGSGRVVFLNYNDLMLNQSTAMMEWNPQPFYLTSLTPWLRDDKLFYDYYYSILGKVLLSAAGKDTGFHISAKPAVVPVERGSLPAAPLEFTIATSNRELKDCSLYYEIRDRENRVVDKGQTELSLARGPTVFSPEVHVFPRGLYVIDAWLKRDAETLDWASAALQVNDKPYLEAIVPDKEYFERNEKISGRISYTNKPEGNQQVVLELRDTYGRLIQSLQFRAAPERFSFEKITCPLSRIYEITCKVKQDDSVRDRCEKRVGLPSSKIEDYEIFGWGMPNGFQRAENVLMHQYKQFGVTGYYTQTGKELAENLAWNNMFWCLYMSVQMFYIGEGETMESLQKHWEDWMTPIIKCNKPYGAAAYDLCEENNIAKDEHMYADLPHYKAYKGKFWDNPGAMADYHRYLKERYQKIERLNEIWGTEFKNFDEINKITFVDAKKIGHPIRWLEQELHKIDRFAFIHEVMAQTVEREQPDSRTYLGYASGMEWDWPRLAKNMRGWTGSQPLSDFFYQKGYYTGQVNGLWEGAASEYLSSITAWENLFRGGTHMHFYPGNGAFSNDLSEPTRFFRSVTGQFREIRSGIGKLLMESTKRIDPIRFLWSNMSYHSALFHPQDIPWEKSMQRFADMFKCIGLTGLAVDPDYVRNELRFNDKNRVLILPFTQAMSRGEAEAIKKFAHDGGLVIADYKPAVLDEYLRPYGNVKTAGEKVEFKECPKCKGKKTLEIVTGGVPLWQPCPLCGGVGEISAGGTPAGESILNDIFDFSGKSVKPYGKGHGFFLNGPLALTQDEYSGMRKLLVERGGIASDVQVCDALGNLRTDLHWYVLDNADTMFLGIVSEMTIKTPPGNKAVVKSAKQYHVYDVRARKYLGFNDTTEIAVPLFVPALLAFLPERIEGITVSIPATSYGPGEVVAVQGKLLPVVLKKSKMVVRIEVIKDNQPVEYFTKNIAFNGQFEYQIPLALNQEKGKYTIRTTEVISGYTQDVGFDLIAAK